MHFLPAAIRESVLFPTDQLSDAICRGARLDISDERGGMEKVRWLESRYARALASAAKGERSSALATEIRFVEVELKEIYVSAGIAKALGIVTGATLSAQQLLHQLGENLLQALQAEGMA